MFLLCSDSSNAVYTNDIGTPEVMPKGFVETEDEEDEEEQLDEALYYNVEKPLSILTADLEKHIRDCKSSKTANFEQQFQVNCQLQLSFSSFFLIEA